MSIGFALSAPMAMASKEVAFLPIIPFLLDADTPVYITTAYTDIHTMLHTDCASCHGDGTGGYLVNESLNDSYHSAITKIDLATPEQSLLLRKPAGLISHNGGVFQAYTEGTANYNLILKWITDGAIYQ